MQNIRFPAVSGAFYPSDPKDLSEAIDFYLQKSLKPPDSHLQKPKALILPHAGYIYSAPVAANGFSLLKSYKSLTFLKSPKILLLGPSHNAYFSGLAACDYDVWKTPLGNVTLDPLNKTIQKENPEIVTVSDKAHDPEHCLEVQIPFLQKIFSDFTIIPLLTGEGEPQKFALALQKYVDKVDLLIISSDLSHHHAFADAEKLDHITLKAIAEFDFESLIEVGEACGMSAIIALLYLSKLNKWEPRLLEYKNSGDTAGDKSQVVGYSSIAFYK